MALRSGSKWAVGLSVGWVALAFVAAAAPSPTADSPSPIGSTTPAPSSSSSAAPSSSAPPSSSASSTAAPKLDPKGKKGMSPQMLMLLKGHAAYLAHDYPAAVGAYKEATTLEPAEPSAYYFLSEAELAAGNAPDAEASLQKGLKGSAASDEWHTKLLYALAELCERQSRFPEARKTWEELVQFASGHTATKAAAATALQRIQAIDAHLELEAKSAAVKQRIEQRLRETGGPPPDEKAPPAKPKK